MINWVENVLFTLKGSGKMEEILKFHLMVLCQNNGSVTTLTEKEIHYLSNWEVEKYRQEK